MDTSPDATALTDLNCIILTANQQAVRLLGFEHVEELVGRSAFEFIAPEDVERATRNAELAYRTGAVRDIEYTALKKDGTRVRVELTASLIRDPGGKPQAFTAVIREPNQTGVTASSVLPRRFSAREAEVYGLLLSGLSNKEIADNLVVSVKTVEFHISHIFRKLGVRSRVEAILHAPARRSSHQN